MTAQRREGRSDPVRGLGSIAGGNPESAVQEAMVRHLGRGDVFYDVGANLGFFSLLAAHLAGLEAGRVVAFEARLATPRRSGSTRRSTGCPTSR